jgi:hypothetical protein
MADIKMLGCSLPWQLMFETFSTAVTVDALAKAAVAGGVYKVARPGRGVKPLPYHMLA